LSKVTLLSHAKMCNQRSFNNLNFFITLLSIHTLALEYNPVANVLAQVFIGRTRVTLLTSNLIRLEVSINTTNPMFDDRATTAVVNRNLPVPAFTVNRINSTAAIISTSSLTITYVDGNGGRDSMCSSILNETDAVDPKRSTDYPNGVLVNSINDCCDACKSDPSCSYYVYETASVSANVNGTYCFPLSSTGGLKTNISNRVLGGLTGGNLPSGSSLSITFGSTTWTPSSIDTLNLNGTYHALDCYSTPMQCNDEYENAMPSGLLSRSGYGVYDDTSTGRIVYAPDAPAGIPTWWDETKTFYNLYDMYFFAQTTLDYKSALSTWSLIMGQPSLLPRSSFGVWWSRYWPYTQTTIVDEVLAGYKNFSIPLNNLVLDMDWHNEPTDKTCESWGNYDINTTKFPDMIGFSQQLHENGIVLGNPVKISFNVHPQTGVDHCDQRYPVIAERMGVDPATNATIPCNFGNKTFTDAVFSIYYDAEPLHLIDIFWTDYGGCFGPNPQLWSNRVYYNHQKFGRQVRGQGFSRYGGLGNQLTPHGFSGDTFQHEVALYWEVKTTSQAANVFWGYWSHDIGGFHSGQGAPGDADPSNSTAAELLLRWIQFGTVSPILRTHCDHCERRIWMFPYFELMRDSMRLRNALGPYIYTEARVFYDTGVAFVHPLYYEAPYDNTVYTDSVKDREYMFGNSILASPITTMANVPNGTLNTPIDWSVYIPDGGKYISWNGTEMYQGPQTITKTYQVGDIPLFVKIGSILPLKTMSSVADNFPDPLVWTFFPYASSGQYTLYEDDGDSDAYQGGIFATTLVSYSGDYSLSSAEIIITINATQVPGALPDGFPQSRSHVLQLRFAPSLPTSVTVNGVSTSDFAFVSEHTLATPLGSLLVNASSLSSFSDNVIVIKF
jgi:alpha-glucosidase (family GH31 glycosyl hydrolase)